MTTAASIWITAALGFLIGIGFHFAAGAGATLTLMALAGFRLVERRLPSEFYAHHTLRFSRGVIMSEDQVRALLEGFGFTIANVSHRLAEAGDAFEYRMVIRSRDRSSAERLSGHLRADARVREFRITPTGD